MIGPIEAMQSIPKPSTACVALPITVPLVLSMGLGIGNATHAVEGFGILCMASIGPIITVMLSGLWARYRAWKQTEAAARTASKTPKSEAEAEAIL